MGTIEILKKLEKANFSGEQALLIADLFDQIKQKKVTREHLEMFVNKNKYQLVKWVIAGIIANGLVAVLLSQLD